MGKASSSKKVARAQKAGKAGRAPRQTGLVFPVSLAVVILLGVGLTFYARNEREPNTTAPTVTDHWHAAVGFYTCDTFQPDLAEGSDPFGIHTHGDGIIHIHPFSSASSGNNARIGRFFETQSVTVTPDQLTLPSGEWKAGTEPGCNGEPAKIVMAKWARESAEEPTIYTEDFGDVRFLNDQELYTIAYVPEDFDTTQIPKPASLPRLAEVVGQGDVPSTTVPGGAATTVPGGAATTVPGGAPTTTATTTAAATSTTGG